MSLEVGRPVGSSALVPAVGAWASLLIVEGLLLALYFVVEPAEIREPRYLVYPFVWINAGLWAVIRTSTRPASPRHRLLGVAAGVGYFLSVMAVPGNVGLGTLGTGFGIRVGWHAPGWGPLLAVSGPVRLYLVPFEAAGYAALAYLVYAAILDLGRTALPGALGLVTCVGCTVPVIAPVIGLLGGPASGLFTTAYAYSYDIGTAVFLLTVVLMTLSREWVTG